MAGGRLKFHRVGKTDSELLFCALLTRLSEPRIEFSDYVQIEAVLHEFNAFGDMNLLFSDSEHLGPTRRGPTSRRAPWSSSRMASACTAHDRALRRSRTCSWPATTHHARPLPFREAGRLRGADPGRRARVSPTFSFYMQVRKPNGSAGPMQFFNYVEGARKLVVYVAWKPETMPAAVLADHKSDLRAALGPAFDVDALEPNVPLAAIGENLDAFKNVIRKLQKSIEPASSSGG